MSKFPYMEFFTGDWLKDPALSLCSPATRGVWIDLLCRMHEAGRSGELRGTHDQLARLARCSTADLVLALTDLQTTGAADVTDRNGIVTVINRRMKEKAETRKADNIRQMRHRVKDRGEPVTELSHDNPADTSNVIFQNSNTRASTSDVRKPNRRSTHDVDAQIFVSEEEIPSILEHCNRIIKVVPLSKDPEQNIKDRSLVFKAVVLSRTALSEHWLADSLEAVRKHRGVDNKMSYFHGVLKSKCQADRMNLNRLLKRVVVPESVLPRPQHA